MKPIKNIAKFEGQETKKRDLIEKAVDFFVENCDFSKHDVHVFASDHYPFNIDTPFTIAITKTAIHIYEADWELIDEYTSPTYFFLNNIWFKDKDISDPIKALYLETINKRNQECGLSATYNRKKSESFKNMIYRCLAKMSELVMKMNEIPEAYDILCFDCDHNDCYSCPKKELDCNGDFEGEFDSILTVYYFGGTELCQ